MGGTVIETESEKLIRRGREAGKAEEIIEMGQEFGLDDAAILKRLQERIGLSLETAAAYLEQYGKQRYSSWKQKNPIDKSIIFAYDITYMAKT